MSKISIVIPTYNCALYITEAIKSVLNQTYKDFEIIIVDDGSTDNTHEIIKSYKDTGKVKYVFQKNKGVAEARNTGILAATGDFIAYVDADDELDSRMIAMCLEQVEKDGTEWCITDILRIQRSETEVKKEICRTEMPENDIKKEILVNDFSRRSPFFRRKTLLEIGLYDKEMLTREDWDMNIRLILKGIPFSYIPKPLYIYKIRSDSLMKKNKKKSYDCTLRLLKKHHKRIADSGNKDIAKIYAHKLWRLGRAYLTDVYDFRSFIFCVVESMKYDFNLKRMIHPFYFYLTKYFIQSKNISRS